jgi:hypothetical protein
MLLGKVANPLCNPPTVPQLSAHSRLLSKEKKTASLLLLRTSLVRVATRWLG